MMADQAEGHWPANVSAVIITPEEKQARLAQAPPGGNPISTSIQHTQVQGAPYANVETKYVIPNTPQIPQGEQSETNVRQDQTMAKKTQSQQTENEPNENQMRESENDSQELVGRSALIAAKKMEIDVLWRTEDKQPIDLETAKELISKDPNSVYFDFDQATELPDPDDLDEEFEEVGEKNPYKDPYMATLSANQIEENPLPTHQTNLPQQGVQFVQPTTSNHISDREKLAWGGVLSTPGQTVYFRKGVVRVEVEGKVTVQKGIQGNVRMLRITRVESNNPVQLANAVYTNVIPPLHQSPNPNVVYRQSMPESEKIPIPRPVVKIPEVNKTSDEEEASVLEESEF
jgi:hypothetical protein